MPRTPVTSTRLERITRAGREVTADLVAVEEPLQILLEHGEPHARRETPLSMTMRTPGHDVDLVTGFLYAEGVISGCSDLLSIRHCKTADTPENVVRAVLHAHVTVPARLIDRALPVTSACGVCGERTVEALRAAGCASLPMEPAGFEAGAVRRALRELEASQAWFRHTGGTHGAASFDGEGRLLLQREDVGRHNALDKLVGASLALDDREPRRSFFVVSSRASFELVQKSVRARVPLLVAIGAPTSLAIDTARRFGLTLVGFASEKRFNVYAGGERIDVRREDLSFVDLEAAV